MPKIVLFTEILNMLQHSFSGNLYNGFIPVFISHNVEHNNIVRSDSLVFILVQTTENFPKVLSQDYYNFKIYIFLVI